MLGFNSNPYPTINSVIVVVDPKPLTRRSLQILLTDAFPKHSCLELSVFENIISENVQIVILNIRNDHIDTPWVDQQIHLINMHSSEIPIVLISDREDLEAITRAFNRGVRGYFPTSSNQKLLVSALKLIKSGGAYVPAQILSYLRSDAPPERSHTNSSSGARSAGANTIGYPDPFDLNIILTSRESDILTLLQEGQTNKQIARRLDMMESTVKVHIRNIFKKYGVQNRTSLVFVSNKLFPIC